MSGYDFGTGLGHRPRVESPQSSAVDRCPRPKPMSTGRLELNFRLRSRTQHAQARHKGNQHSSHHHQGRIGHGKPPFFVCDQLALILMTYLMQ